MSYQGAGNSCYTRGRKTEEELRREKEQEKNQYAKITIESSDGWSKKNKKQEKNEKSVLTEVADRDGYM
ncbi:MAG: hypothetical protein Q8797_00825 [Candidatus Phytoplasma australasiaticum]|nr:hypothetical protein [Candidatus Phytoplasma australasiaticum]